MKWKVWLLAIASYLVTFGVPLGASYHYFVKPYDAGVGGSIFYFVSSIIFIIMLKRILNGIKKMKASIPKAIFKTFTAIISMTILFFAVQYIGKNFESLVNVILFSGGARVVGAGFEIWAITIDKNYVEEIGVL